MKELTVTDLIKGVEKKQFLLPTIQRGFVWESKKIETLFDSLLRGFPISSFLFWEVTDEDENTFKFYNFVKDYNFYGEDSRSFAEFKKSPHMAVLDGQQRITSFYIGLKGSYIPKGKAEVPQKLYLNLLKINADSDIGDDDAGLDNVYNFKFLTDADAAVTDSDGKFPPDEFNKLCDKTLTVEEKPARKFEDILNMATRIEKQFANAAVTSDGKFMFYADHCGIEIKHGSPKWNPSFWIIKKDLISKRVSLDIITQEVAPQNVFVEVTKINVDTARKVAKKRGNKLALQYLEDTGRI